MTNRNGLIPLKAEVRIHSLKNITKVLKTVSKENHTILVKTANDIIVNETIKNRPTIPFGLNTVSGMIDVNRNEIPT